MKEDKHAAFLPRAQGFTVTAVTPAVHQQQSRHAGMLLEPENGDNTLLLLSISYTLA